MRGAAAFVYPRRRTTHKYATVGLLTTHDGLAEIDTKSQILVENRDFFAQIRVSRSEYCHNIWCEKTRMVWLPDAEKV